jgi:hypothetical protein
VEKVGAIEIAFEGLEVQMEVTNWTRVVEQTAKSDWPAKVGWSVLEESRDKTGLFTTFRASRGPSRIASLRLLIGTSNNRSIPL